MKVFSLALLAILPAALGNPITENTGPAAVPAVQADSLTKRESCSVTGKGGLNVS